MTFRTISRENLDRLLNSMIERMALYGPKERAEQPGFYHFGRIGRAEEIEMNGAMTAIPPKSVFFPPRETLFRFSTEPSPPDLTPEIDETPFVLAGVHPCDLSGIEALDIACGQPPADHRWLFNRRRAVIIGVDCMPDEYCFCDSVNAANTRNPADIFLTPVSGGFLAEIRTPRGREWISSVDTGEARDGHMEAAEAYRREKTRRMKNRLAEGPEKIARALESGGGLKIWEDTASRCFSCGSCTLVCPACFCFHIDDRFDLNLTTGYRFRSWDSCQFRDFTMIAGGHRFRDERRLRIRHRLRRKFLFLFKEFGRPFCTGCGRCGRVCAAGIRMPGMINRLIEEAGAMGEGEQH